MNLKAIFIVLIAIVLILFGAFFHSRLDDQGADFTATFFTALSALAAAFAAVIAAYSANVAERAAHTWKTQMVTEIELQEAKDVKVSLNAWKRHFIAETQAKKEKTLGDIEDEIGLWYHNPDLYIEHLNNHANELNSLWNAFEKALDSTSIIGLKNYHRDRLYQIHSKHFKACRDLMVILRKADRKDSFISTETVTAIYDFKDWHQIDEENIITIYKVEAETFTQGGLPKKYTKADGMPVYINPFEEVLGTCTNIGMQVDKKIEDTKHSLK